MKDCIPWERPYTGAGEEPEEWQRKYVMNRRQPPFLVPLCCPGGGGREIRSEVEPRKK